MQTTTRSHGPVAPDDDELTGLADLHRLLQESIGGNFTIIGPDGDSVALGASALDALRQVTEALARDRVITIQDLAKDLTLDEIESLVDIPRVSLVQLVDQGTIPSRTINGRRVRFSDLMAFADERAKVRREALRFLATQGQDITSLLESDADRENEETAPTRTGEHLFRQ